MCNMNGKTTIDIKTLLVGGAIFLAFGAAVLFGTYLFFAALIEKLNSVNSDIGKAVLGAAATIIVAVLSIVVAKLWEQRTAIKNENRQKKIPIYEAQIDTFFDLIFANKTGKQPMNTEKLEKGFADFTKKLIIWGSEDVILKWNTFRTTKWDKVDPLEMMMAFEDFLLALRKDIGNKTGSLPKGTLLSLFLNDWEESQKTNNSKQNTDTQ